MQHNSILTLHLPVLTFHSWRWSMWELLWLSGLILLPLFFLLPETSTPTLLYHKARRLRATGRLATTIANTHSATKHPTRANILKLALIKPLEITLKDPAIAFVNVYVRLQPSNSLLLGQY